MLNEIELDWIFEHELDAQHQKEIRNLAQSLELSLEDRARLAPSIILRSELEFFGCSSPRFAYRIYFKDALGFANIRRLRQLASSIRINVLGPTGKITGLMVPQQGVRSILNTGNQSCIADCLLQRPNFLPERRFHLITTSLSSAYGETSSRLGFPDYPATPFVKNITLGGGLCAQACCFMSAALMHEHSSGVHGLGEITALAHSPRSRTLNLSGMNARLMRRYFSTISLSLTVQSPHPFSQKPPADKARATAAEFETAVRAYSLSNIPVIIPADQGRMLGFPSLSPEDPRDETADVYDQNGCEFDLREFDRTRTHRHCYVVVGCEKHSESGQARFIFNDPSGHPFMSASTPQIGNCEPYYTPPARGRNPAL